MEHDMRRVCLRVIHLAVALITLSLVSAEAVSQLKVDKNTDLGPLSQSTAPPRICPRPLSDFYPCREGSKCPTYEEAVREAEGAGPHDFAESSAGSCGDLRFVSIDAQLVGWSMYFNSDGKLVAVRGWTDRLGDCVLYGPQPQCKELRERILFKRKPPPANADKWELR
jgi:hypothetical protein